MRIVKGQEISSQVPGNVPTLLLHERTLAGRNFRLLAVGDIGFSGRVGRTADTKGYDAILKPIAPFLQSGEIVFGNLEFPLAGKLHPGAMFSAHPDCARAIKDAGFTVLNVATNHAADYGREGLRATLDAVASAGLTALGGGSTFADAKKLTRTDFNGFRVGWLAAGRSRVDQDWDEPHYWEFNEDEILAAVKDNRSSVDILIVSLHLGLMYLDYPRPDHKHFAEVLLDEGVDTVLMHHAHVLQGVQVSADGRTVAYNLGNFVLDWREGNVEVATMAQQQQEGGIFVFDFDEKGIARAAVLPTFTDETCCVQWAMGDRGHQILERLIRISKDLEGDYEPLFERQRSERNAGPALEVMLFHLKRGNLGYVVSQLSRVRFEHLRMLMRLIGSKLSMR